jgi:hypothetical protein
MQSHLAKLSLTAADLFLKRKSIDTINTRDEIIPIHQVVLKGRITKCSIISANN